MRPLLWLLTGAVAVLYPVLVYVGVRAGQLGAVLALLLVVAVLRLVLLRRQALVGATRTLMPLVTAVLLVVVAGSWFSGETALLRYYPVAVNALFGAVFAWTLWRGPSMIERLARLREPDLPASGVRYTRRVTQVWCGFFAANGGIALYTALAGDWALWTLYNGLVAYLLIGALLGGEWLLRRWLLRRWLRGASATAGENSP